MRNRISWSCSLAFVGILGVGLVLIFYLRAEMNHQKVLIDQKAERLLKQILYSQEDCTAPCWRELVPGQLGMDTYQRMAYELEESGFVLRYTSEGLNRELYDGQEYTVHSWFDPKEELYFYIYIDAAGYVQHIYFSDITLTSLDNLFTILNEPDYYIAEYGVDIHSYVTLVLLYVEEGIVIRFQGMDLNQLTDDCRLHLSKLQTIIISLVAPGDPVEMLKDSIYRIDLPPRPIQSWTEQNDIQVQGCLRKPQGN